MSLAILYIFVCVAIGALLVNMFLDEKYRFPISIQLLVLIVFSLALTGAVYVMSDGYPAEREQMVGGVVYTPRACFAKKPGSAYEVLLQGSDSSLRLFELKIEPEVGKQYVVTGSGNNKSLVEYHP
jgi:hypothetical protein